MAALCKDNSDWNNYKQILPDLNKPDEVFELASALFADEAIAIGANHRDKLKYLIAILDFAGDYETTHNMKANLFAQLCDEPISSFDFLGKNTDAATLIALADFIYEKNQRIKSLNEQLGRACGVPTTAVPPAAGGFVFTVVEPDTRKDIGSGATARTPDGAGGGGS